MPQSIFLLRRLLLDSASRESHAVCESKATCDCIARGKLLPDLPELLVHCRLLLIFVLTISDFGYKDLLQVNDSLKSKLARQHLLAPSGSYLVHRLVLTAL